MYSKSIRIKIYYFKNNSWSFNNNNNYISDKQIKKDFNGNNIKFKKFDNIDNDLCFKDNEFIYFSSNKLGENLN